MRFSLLRATKKGSLELSTNAIVVIVLAFVMLGLGLSIIRIVGNNATSQIPKALSLADLSKKPDPTDPIAITNPLQAQYAGTTPVDIGYYNADPSNHQGVSFSIDSCLDPQTGAATNSQNLPKITALPQDVDASTGAGFSAFISIPKSGSQTDLTSGKSYICNLKVTSTDATPPTTHMQLTLTVTS